MTLVIEDIFIGNLLLKFKFSGRIWNSHFLYEKTWCYNTKVYFQSSQKHPQVSHIQHNFKPIVIQYITSNRIKYNQGEYTAFS